MIWHCIYGKEKLLVQPTDNSNDTNRSLRPKWFKQITPLYFKQSAYTRKDSTQEEEPVNIKENYVFRNNKQNILIPGKNN